MSCRLLIYPPLRFLTFHVVLPLIADFSFSQLGRHNEEVPSSPIHLITPHPASGLKGHTMVRERFLIESQWIPRA